MIKRYFVKMQWVGYTPRYFGKNGRNAYEVDSLKMTWGYRTEKGANKCLKTLSERNSRFNAVGSGKVIKLSMEVE